MKTLNNTYFNPSGCLNKKALADYVFGNVKDEEIVFIQDHISECSLCADAVEGVFRFQSKAAYYQSMKTLRAISPENNKQRVKISANQRGTIITAVASIAAAILVMFYLFNMLHDIEIQSIPSAFREGVVDLYPVNEKPAPPEYRAAIEAPLNEADKAANIYFESTAPNGSADEKVTQIEPQQPIGNKPIRTNPKTLSALRTLHSHSKKMENKPVQEFQLVFPADKPRYGYSFNDQDVVVGRFKNNVNDRYTLPSFQSGDVETFLKYIKKNIRYPQEAIDKDISGIVMVDFTINEFGKVVGVKVSRGVHPLLDNEAFRVISDSPRWIPGRTDGRVSAVNFTCPVVFKLSKR